jgi:D-alanyl-D-alanine carboxypeptidase/D-alanyl-D-alanine-endopeptidase (penicillin-binding protein 4)
MAIRAVADDVPPSPPAQVRVGVEPWMQELEALIGDRPLSASVVVDGRSVYGHLAGVARAPASNEKLLLSMAELDRFGPRHRIPTEAAGRRRMRHGVVRGDLYLVGHGDPELDAGDLHRLALGLREAGLTRVEGGVVGDTGTFVRDRRAPGWHPIALRYIGLPTALSYQANVDASGFVFDPERRAAGSLDAELRALGVRMGAPPHAGDAPEELGMIAEVRSDPLSAILRRQNVSSINLDAETLSKGLATATLHRPGSIAGGAHVIETYANGLDAGVTLHDASGLSYRDRVTTASMAALLDDARARSWGDALTASLPAPGEGTLRSRLAGVPVRAKTGTLIEEVSALSGYVRLRDGRWASFSIMSALPKDGAVALEDAIVRTIAASA